MTQDFSSEQKRWLEGFVSGAAAVRALKQSPPPVPGAADAPHEGPDAALFEAQDRAAKVGKLVDPEKWKRAAHPMDSYARLKATALAGEAPKPDENFRWRYHGLFYAAPTQASYMCRLRLPNGILTHWQMHVVAALAAAKGGGYAHVTTRANLQIREIAPRDAPDVVETLAGADNIRNVTGSATAGIDPTELLDTRAQARALHFHILNERALYGLPRKFNISFDGGATLATLEDTNDIGFQAVEVLPGATVAPGIWYRLALGGITGHKDFAGDTGVVIAPDEAVAVADAILRVYIANGDRTDRAKARLKYVLDAWGFEKFLAAIEERLGRKLARVDAEAVRPRAAHDRLAHLGVHRQKQPGLNWIGVATPLGRMTAAEMHALADVARDCGDGDIRLTVWQNLLISGVPDAAVETAKAAIVAAGLATEVSNARAGLVACTGNTGCKFAASNTKRHALMIADHLDQRLVLDQPVNIHLTGCPNSCAQHYIGDIGLLGIKIAIGDEGDQVEGYQIHAGGGFGNRRSLGRLIYSDVKAHDAPARVEALLEAYLAHRATPQESFHAFSARHDVETLRRLAEEAAG